MTWIVDLITLSLIAAVAFAALVPRGPSAGPSGLAGLLCLLSGAAAVALLLQGGLFGVALVHLGVAGGTLMVCLLGASNHGWREVGRRTMASTLKTLGWTALGLVLLGVVWCLAWLVTPAGLSCSDAFANGLAVNCTPTRSPLIDWLFR